MISKDIIDALGKRLTEYGIKVEKTTDEGSHLWKMSHAKSDIDAASVYIMNSRDWLLGKKPKGKQVFDDNLDTTYYELEHMITHLLKGNCNYIWAVMSPITISKYRNALVELRQIVATTISKKCYHSINGLAQHNIYHFIEHGDRHSAKYKKKLNIIGRSLKFGINALLWGKYMFAPVDIQNEMELYQLKYELNNAFESSTLPEEPEREPYENYLIKWRLKKMKMDELI